MARRLTLIVLLAYAAASPATVRKHASDSEYSSESLDPFILIDDYDSVEPERISRPMPPSSVVQNSLKPQKVIIRTKNPKVNTTVKYDKDLKNKKKVFKTTTINIESNTNVIVTEKTPKISAYPHQPFINYPHRPMYIWYEDEGSFEPIATIVRPPPKKHRETTTSKPVARESTTIRPRKTTKRTTTRKPTTTKKPTTRKPTTTTKPKNGNKKTTCPPKNTNWISSFFQKEKKTKKKPAKKKQQGGFLNTIYGWIWGPSKASSSSWFSSDGWFQGETKNANKKIKTTTTTAPPMFATTANWFQNLVESEEEESDISSEKKKSPKQARKRKTYKGFQLLRAYPDVQWKVREMIDFQEEADGSGIMWWTQPSLNGTTDVLVPPDLLSDVKDHFKSNNVEFDVVIWDLQKAILYENPRLSKKQRMELEQVRGHPLTWRRYHRYADILRYLEYLQHSYGDIVELVPLGRSSEGLPLVVVKVSMSGNDTTRIVEKNTKARKKWRLRSRLKPAVWIEGGAHAREWISPAVALWFLHALLEGEKGLEAEHELLREADFYIMPVLNPDGYEYSHTHDRLWRKTRSRHNDLNDDYTSWLPWNWGGGDCVGVDPDRNWDYHWGEKDASKDPCSEYYAGPHPFSEPETRAVSSYITEHRDEIKAYITLHSYSQVWLTPSSHAHAPFSDDGVLMEMGKLATSALTDMYGTKYQVGTAAELRQPASGMSHDWAKARARVKYSYHVDLRDSQGPYGFLLPGSQIASTATETWQAVKAIVENLGP